LTDATSVQAYVRVGLRAAVTEGAATIVPIGRYEVAIFSVDGRLYAYENACPHQGGPIGEGIVEDATVTCPWHAWCFDLRTGKLTLGDFAELRRFEIYAEDGAIFVAREPVRAP
jgi:nitrite reductase/ring-hydroxylating ferredoxin subunit